MLNLVLKDFKLLGKNIIFIIVYAVLMSVFFQKGMSHEIAYGITISLIAYMMSMYPAGYDNRRKCDVVLASLPIKRNEIVIARYISCILNIMLSFIIIYCSSIIIGSIQSVIEITPPGLNDLAVTFVIIGILQSVSMPVNFIFGEAGVRIVNSTLFLAFIIVPNLLVKILKSNPQNGIAGKIMNMILLGPGTIKLYLIIITAILLVISLLISILAYDKRELA